MARPAAAPSKPASSAPVLVVEDNPTDQKVMARMLQRLGWACDVVERGDQAVRAAVAGGYDFVLMDLEMPELNGLDATRRIRLEMGPRSPYIVAVSSYTKPSDRLRCSDAGMDDFLPKPVRFEALAWLLRPGVQPQRGGSQPAAA